MSNLDNDIKALQKGQDICVPATVSRESPHCSLMVFVTDEECRGIYMTTFKNSANCRNLERNPHMSIFLIDDRNNSPRKPRQGTKALTVNGMFRRVEDKGGGKRIRKSSE